VNKLEWTERVIHAVGTAARGDRRNLLTLAQRLADTDTAIESLVLAGYGDESDELIDMVAVVVERQAVNAFALAQ